jgi:DNA-binding response OmpR family regulator
MAPIGASRASKNDAERKPFHYPELLARIGAVLGRVSRSRDREVTWDPDLPIIMLSAKAEHVDRVRGLQRGADDYVTKPFHYPELLARIGAVLGRVSRSRDREVIRHRDLSVNMLSREVTVGGIKVDLSAKEYQLLTTLASEPGRVFTKAELLESVWGFRSQGRTRTLDSHASRLRQKLRVHSAAGWLANEWGVGYRLCRPE